MIVNVCVRERERERERDRERDKGYRKTEIHDPQPFMNKKHALARTI